jgi:hypothetical protein
MIMTTVMRRRMPGMTGQAGSMARQLAGAGALAGLLGGLAMIEVMILVMGAAGMGYATPLNVGMASFAFTIAAVFEERLAAALADYPGAVVRRRQVADEQEAAETGMAGSPTLLINGADPFAAPDPLCVNTIRGLCMDAIERASSGHPGTRWAWRRSPGSRTPCSSPPSRPCEVPRPRRSTTASEPRASVITP